MLIITPWLVEYAPSQQYYTPMDGKITKPFSIVIRTHFGEDHKDKLNHFFCTSIDQVLMMVRGLYGNQTASAFYTGDAAPENNYRAKLISFEELCNMVGGDMTLAY